MSSKFSLLVQEKAGMASADICRLNRRRPPQAAATLLLIVCPFPKASNSIRLKSKNLVEADAQNRCDSKCDLERWRVFFLFDSKYRLPRNANLISKILLRHVVRQRAKFTNIVANMAPGHFRYPGGNNIAASQIRRLPQGRKTR